MVVAQSDMEGSEVAFAAVTSDANNDHVTAPAHTIPLHTLQQRSHNNVPHSGVAAADSIQQETIFTKVNRICPPHPTRSF